MKLQRVISREGNKESPTEIFWQRTAVVVQEEVIVAERRHGHAHLCQIEQVLHAGHLQKRRSREERTSRRGSRRGEGKTGRVAE